MFRTYLSALHLAAFTRLLLPRKKQAPSTRLDKRLDFPMMIRGGGLDNWETWKTCFKIGLVSVSIQQQLSEEGSGKKEKNGPGAREGLSIHSLLTHEWPHPSSLPSYDPRINFHNKVRKNEGSRHRDVTLSAQLSTCHPVTCLRGAEA